MTYIMKNKNEAKRLHEQSQNNLFLPKKDLEQIKLKKSETVLDAGCGSGIFTIELLKKYPHSTICGCDIDMDQLDFARSNSNHFIKYFQADLLKNSLADKYDTIFNRYVAHHFSIKQYFKILKNLHHSLNKNGSLVVIDADGVLNNIGTTNKVLIDNLKTFNEKFGGDLLMARKIPSMMKLLGLKNIRWNIEVMDFTYEDRLAEVKQWEQRIEFGMNSYIAAFGSKFKAKNFKKLFLETIKDESTPLFYNKFIIIGEK